MASLRPLAVALTLVSPVSVAAAAQCDGSVIDILESPLHGSVTATVRGTQAVVVSRDAFTVPSRLQLFTAAPGSIEFRYGETISPPGWLAGWRVLHVALDDDLIAHQLYKGFGGVNELAITERTPGGWNTSALPLPGDRWLKHGQITAASGGRIATITSDGYLQPLVLHIVERGATGLWSLTDSVTINDILSPWIDDLFFVALMGDAAAVATTGGATAGLVALSEPDSQGVWQQTALLNPPADQWWAVEGLAFDSGRLAVLRIERQGNAVGAVHVYGRQSSGAWTIEDRIAVTNPAGTGVVGNLVFDDNRIAVRSSDGTTIYERTALGSWQAARRFVGLGRVIALDDDKIVGVDRARVRVAEAPRNAGPLIVESLCSLAGQQTCQGSGASQLRVHDRVFGSGARRVIAEVTGATPGRTVVLFRSPDPSTGTLPAGGLCIDRWTALPVGVPRAIGATGHATFEIRDLGMGSANGFGAADHLQAAIFGAGLEWTNAVAWIP